MDQAKGFLISACDAGSANFFGALLPEFRGRYHLVAQEPAFSILQRNHLSPEGVPRDLPFDRLLQLSREIIARLQPRAVILGTSWGLTLDKALTLAAREIGCLTYAVIEHWSLYRERFSLVERGSITRKDEFLPNEAWVIDEMSFHEAVEAGVPQERIRVVGQPFLERRLEQLSKVPLDPKAEKQVVFVSERVAEDFPRGSASDRGYDEFEVFDRVQSACKKLNLNLVVKLHPQEPRDKFNQYGASVFSGASFDSALVSSRKIVGMESMLLLEASMVRPDVLSVLPPTSQHYFVGARLGICHSAWNTPDIEAALSLPRQSGSELGPRFEGASQKLLKVLEDLSK